MLHDVAIAVDLIVYELRKVTKIFNVEKWVENAPLNTTFLFYFLFIFYFIFLFYFISSKRKRTSKKIPVWILS
jgi:hypothetical protein